MNDIEVVLLHFWNESRLIVSEIDFEQNIVRFTGQIGGEVGRGDHRNRYYIENVLEALDQPGEWYLDVHAGNLYYWAVEGTMDPELRAPFLNELVRFEGNVKEKQSLCSL